MADPRADVGALRGLSVPPPARPAIPAPARESADQDADRDRAVVPDRAGNDGGGSGSSVSDTTTPAVTEPAAAEGRTGPGGAATTVEDRPERTASGASPRPRRPRRTTSAAPSLARRDKATTLYLAAQLRDALAAERVRRGMSQADLVLEAVRDHYQDVADKLRSPQPAPGPLGLPAPRRPRRRVDGGAGVQFRFTLEEHGALERLAADTGVGMSELVSACLGAALNQRP